MKSPAKFFLSAIAGLLLALLIGMLLVMPGLFGRMTELYLRKFKWEKTWNDFKSGPSELITIRYRVHALYCIDKQENMIEVGPLGFWKVRSIACWRVKSDVLAGYRWEDLGLYRKDNRFYLRADEPNILGIDYKGAELIYSKNWSGLSLKEQDFLNRVRPALIRNAEQLGIKKDAEQRLFALADMFSAKIHVPVQVQAGKNF